MVNLCHNRTDPFGPEVDGHLTTCFTDVVLVPLATWVFLLLSIVAFVVLAPIPPRNEYESEKVRRGAGIFARIIKVLYLILIVCEFGMQILEITRLAIANNGIGLLPFTLAGLMIAFALAWIVHLVLNKREGNSGRLVGRLVLLAYWAMSTAFEAVKLREWVRVQKGLGDPGPTLYPSSDKVIDNIVMVALYGVFFVFELLLFGIDP